jgi:hypothetical protein
LGRAGGDALTTSILLPTSFDHTKQQILAYICFCTKNAWFDL